jgi:hypothetical protein
MIGSDDDDDNTPSSGRCRIKKALFHNVSGTENECEVKLTFSKRYLCYGITLKFVLLIRKSPK